MNRVELLSPAGDYSCFLAAINSGADAVYLSGEKYGARAYAKNFTQEELLNAIDYAHVFNRKVFMTVNTLVKDNELEELYDFLLPYYKQGLDGVIVQDMGVISYIRRNFPDLPVHASTQLAITGLEGINLLEKEGVVRTVLAREVSLDEIRHIHNNSDMEIECFVHGALCYSYSGKCLFSSLVGGRSGNRGRCAGSCRQPYNDKYVLSTKDICCLSIIPDLIDAGIVSFKIEGRMKSPEYVAGVTAIYRKYIDIYYSNISKMSSEEIKKKYFTGKDFNNDLDTLLRLYTRGGNSTGYYFKHNGKEMITLKDASYKSDKGEVKSLINETYISNGEKIKISGRIFIAPLEKMLLSINDEVFTEGVEALVADKRPIDEDTVRKQLTKTKDTEFVFDDIQFDIADNAFVRVSDLNELRRDAINSYRENLLAKYRRVQSEHVNTSLNRQADKSTSTDADSPFLTCEINSPEQFDVLVNKPLIKRIYVPAELLMKNGDYYFDKAKQNDKEIYIKFQSVIRYNYLEKNSAKLAELADKADGILADSHEVIEFLNDRKLIGDIHIYGLNNEAVTKYHNIGVKTLTVPVELNKKELLRRGIYGEELIVYGYLPMMISAQCVNKTLNTCDKNKKEIILKDRKGAEFKAVNHCESCSNIIYNNVPLSLHSEGDFIRKIKPQSLRLIFTIENEDDTNKIADFYSSFVNNDFEYNKNDLIFKENSFTKGHLNRGVQ